MTPTLTHSGPEILAPFKTWNFCKIKHLTFLILFSAEDKNVVYMWTEQAVDICWSYEFCSLKGGFSTVSWLAQVAIHHASLPSLPAAIGVSETEIYLRSLVQAGWLKVKIMWHTISWETSHMIYPHQLCHIRPLFPPTSSPLYFTEAGGSGYTARTVGLGSRNFTGPATDSAQRLTGYCKILLVRILITEICSAPTDSGMGACSPLYMRLLWSRDGA